MDTQTDTYRKVHFAVMAIEASARKAGISGKEMPFCKDNLPKRFKKQE